MKFNSNDEVLLLETIESFGSINDKEENINIQNNININIIGFNPQNIKNIKQLSNLYSHDSRLCANLSFFISKNKEYILAYTDKNTGKSIIFYDINNDKEIKRINNAHEASIITIKYYDYYLYDIILTSSSKNEIKLWNYNQSLNILTINNIFNNSNYVGSSALVFDNNTFYILCSSYAFFDYIKVYNSSGNLYKTIGNKDDYSYDIEIDEINENKYIITGGNKGVNIFNYPSFSNYYRFREENDTCEHVYAKIIKINNIYNLIDVGSCNKIKIWDFYKKILIKCITSNSKSGLGGFILINNKYLIIASWDKEIKVIDMNNGIIAATFNKHESKVIGIKAIYNKDNNQYFVSYGCDNKI